MKNIQLSIFYDYQMILLSSNFYRKYNALFSALDLTGFPDKNTEVGRTGYSLYAILRALIVKHLEEIKSIPRLIEFLDAHPVLTEMCGFTMGDLPDESQFYRFIKEIPNRLIQKIHHKINKIFIEKNLLILDTFALPKNKTDAEVAKKLIRKLKRIYKFKNGCIFIADSAYDVRELYDLIVNQMKCRAFIPLNPRNTQKPKTLGPHGAPIFDSGLEMAFNSAWHAAKCLVTQRSLKKLSKNVLLLSSTSHVLVGERSSRLHTTNYVSSKTK